jgi:hypothetical protein
MDKDAYLNFSYGIIKLKKHEYRLAHAVNDIIESMIKSMYMTIASYDDFDPRGMDRVSGIEDTLYVYLKQINPEAAKQCERVESLGR